MKVIVSNFVRQHSHLLVKTLYEEGILLRFFTSIGRGIPKGNKSKNFLEIIFNNQLKKRSYGIPKSYIRTIPYFELTRQILKRTGFKLNLWQETVFEILYDKVLSKKINQLDYDIFIGAEKSSYYSFKIAKKKGKTTILDLAAVHFNQNEILRERYQEYKGVTPDKRAFKKLNQHKAKEFNHIDYFFCLSDYAKNSLIREGINSNRIFVHYLGVDPKIFQPKKNYFLHKKSLKILYVGRISRLKGIQIILEAAQRLLKDSSEYEFSFVGPLDKSFKICQFAKFTNVKYFPFVHHQELVNFYQNHDLFVSPSFTDSWGQTVLESMACGTPVIITENTGAKDAVKLGGGHIIPVNDVDSLMENLIFYRKEKYKLEELGKKATEIAKQFSLENYSSSVLNSLNIIGNQHNLHSKTSNSNSFTITP